MIEMVNSILLIAMSIFGILMLFIAQTAQDIKEWKQEIIILVLAIVACIIMYLINNL